jgi:hypothetical protein
MGNKIGLRGDANRHLPFFVPEFCGGMPIGISLFLCLSFAYTISVSVLLSQTVRNQFSVGGLHFAFIVLTTWAK